MELMEMWWCPSVAEATATMAARTNEVLMIFVFVCLGFYASSKIVY
jgi:hypothetical protein